MTPEQWVTGIVAVAGALGIREFAPGFVAWLTGRADRERDRVAELMRERDAAEADLDVETTYRRKVEEFASLVVRAFYLKGGTADELPAWPTRPVTGDKPQGQTGTP